MNILSRLRRVRRRQVKPETSIRSGKARRIGREHFIPVRAHELIEKLAASPAFSPSEAAAYRSLCRHLETLFHSESRRRLRQLTDDYSYVNPDSDTETLSRTTARERERAISGLFEEFVELLARANFCRLSQLQIEAAIGSASAMGVRVDTDRDSFDRLAVFARGAAVVGHTPRSWTNWFRQERHEIPMYQRLVVIFRRKSTQESEATEGTAYIRLFKNVPQQDVDMALPDSQVCMSLIDRGKILLPSISGLGLVAFKLIKGMMLLAFAGFYGLLALVGLVGGVIGSGMKSVNGYVRTKNQYELSLTRNLYYQNLDNNAGVLLRLAAEAEAQELREAVLAYFVLWSGKDEGCTADNVDRRAEAALRECGLEVDFEVTDALAKLRRLGLCQLTETRLWKATVLEEAVKAVMSRNLRDTLSVAFENKTAAQPPTPTLP